jgi:hypothetical protein
MHLQMGITFEDKREPMFVALAHPRGDIRHL